MTNEDEKPLSDEPEPIRAVSLRSFESLIDRQFRAAEAAGTFRDLPGAGSPLDLDNDRDVPEELRVGFRILKNAGYAPPWIELHKRIRAEQASLCEWRARANERWPGLGSQERSALRAEYERRIIELNRQITSYNLTAPPAAGQLPLLVRGQELKQLGDG